MAGRIRQARSGSCLRSQSRASSRSSFSGGTLSTRFSDAAGKPKDKPRKRAEFSETAAVEAVPLEPFWRPASWQVHLKTSDSRVAALFNSHSLSDVLFDVEDHSFPAHKFVLASASPVFQRLLYKEQTTSGPEGYDSGRSSPCSRGRHWRETITVVDVAFSAFFEFLRFVYTNTVNITLANVLCLIFLADTFQVAGLTEACLDYLRSILLPETALRVLSISRTLLLKAIVLNWRSTTRREKNERLKATGPRQRPTAEERRLAAMTPNASRPPSAKNTRGGAAATAPSGASEAARALLAVPASGSAAPSRSGSKRQSRRESMISRRSAVSNSSFIGDAKSNYGDGGRETPYDDDFSQVLIAPSRIGLGHFKGNMIEVKISAFIRNLISQVWVCIAFQTEQVLSSSDVSLQTHATLRELLSIECCHVQEINFFRAMNDWAGSECERQGLAVTPQNKRQTLGSLLRLIRFPAMTMEQLQWEVVPTGLLEYADAQNVLYTVTGRCDAAAAAFETESRSARTTRETGASRRGSETAMNVTNEMMRLPNGWQPYRPAQDDMMDTMLAGELLRGHLKRTTGRVTAAPASARLPRLAPLAGAGGEHSRCALATTPRPAPRDPRQVAATRERGMNLLPRWEDTPPLTKDFKRIVAGRSYGYRLREVAQFVREDREGFWTIWWRCAEFPSGIGVANGACRRARDVSVVILDDAVIAVSLTPMAGR
eukprot:TRINITY_DN5264_c1_g1_i3.p1 TRINITY_DN5264_c1_g1~~TRINITY_DN5264_c1_g1_i3.p1  ORF type:complete len:715 (+),score=99.86 TRINITY_DN5264_c1_g1_i3:204-2348(+)